MTDLDTFLDDFLFKKIVNALVRASVVFYIKSLLVKGKKHRKGKEPFFHNNFVALVRMEKDITIMREYFDSFVPNAPELSKVIEEEFHVLITVIELMRIADGISDSDPRQFIAVLHKRIKDENITRLVVKDLWHLTNPSEKKKNCRKTSSLMHTLVRVSPPQKVKFANDRTSFRGLSLEKTLSDMFDKCKRKNSNKIRRIKKDSEHANK